MIRGRCWRTVLPMLGRDRTLLVTLGAVALALVLGHDALGLSTHVLHFVPALALLVPLVMGRYVGEDAIARLGARLARRRPWPRRTVSGRARPALRSSPCGGQLIARASRADRP
jgi:hypothetical protein